MRKYIVAGNWKMNKNLQEGIELAMEVEKLYEEKGNKNVKVVIAPPFIHLTEIRKSVKSIEISVSAQNCASEPQGAFTGEVSAEMIWSAGADYCIIGHSERRTYYKEDNRTLNQKVKLAIENTLVPIFCIGETLEERDKGTHFDVVKNQLFEGVFNLNKEDFSTLVIAYEPVWAIGTGRNATSAQAQEMHAYIRNLIEDHYGKAVSSEISILYGGSCKLSNARELFSQPDVDGGLIGGASLVAGDFIEIVNACKC